MVKMVARGHAPHMAYSKSKDAQIHSQLLPSDVLQHAGSVILLVPRLFKEHVIDQKECSEQDSLDFNIQVHGETDAKIVRVGERLFQQPRPLLANAADFYGAIL